MYIPIDFDPEWHALRPLPVEASLRRDTKQPNIVTYFHKGTKKWLVALKSANGRQLLELDYVDGVDGTQTFPQSREHYQRLVRLLTVLLEKKEVKRRLRQREAAAATAHIEEEEAIRDAYLTIYRDMKRAHGEHHADQWARRVGFNFDRRKVAMPGGMY